MNELPIRHGSLATFTTGEVARICQVSVRTVGRWIDSGQLKGRKVPGSSYRRVDRPDLDRFVAEHGIDNARYFLKLEDARLATIGDKSGQRNGNG